MKFLKPKKYNVKTPNIELIYRVFIASIAYALTIIAILPSHIQVVPPTTIGEVVEVPLIVKKDTRYKNNAETENRIEYARLQTSPVFDIPLNGTQEAKKNIKSIFAFIRIAQDEKVSINDMYYNFISKFNIAINKNIFINIVKDSESIDYESKLLSLVNYFYNRPIISKANIRDETKTLIANNGILVNKYTDYIKEYYIVKNSDIFFLEDLSPNMVSIVESEFKTISATSINTLSDFMNAFLKDNAFYNANKTLARSEENQSNVEPVYTTLKKGYTILEEGEIVTEDKINLIAFIYSNSGIYYIINFISEALLILFIFIFVGFTLIYNKLDLYKDIKKYTFVIFEYAIIILILYFTNNYWIYFLDDTYLPFYIYTFIPMFSMINVLFGTRKEVSITLTTSFCLLTASIASANVLETFTLFTVSVLASIFAKNINKRKSILLIGLLIGLSYVIASILNISSYDNTKITYVTLLLSLLTGILQSLAIMVFLPIFEYILNTATIFTLQELADLNNPLLRELQKKAPGTYHHSINLGALVETIARSIGEDPKLACVSGYYHDIGKLENPLYYIENTTKRENRHNGLKPTLSASIIKSHVKLGADIAKKYRLPKEIINAIKEHHGTSFIRYFYYEALKENPDVDKDLFTYSGPKPQSKITAIIMLIDSIEAASRSLDNPKREDIETLIRQIINDKIVSGELNDSKLTLNDIDKIQKLSFQQIIISFHERVKYPDMENKKGPKTN